MSIYARLKSKQDNALIRIANNNVKKIKLLEENKIDILCMQETEVTNDINFNELNTSKYCLELENNSVKSRVGFYISKDINYVRRSDLEGKDSNIIIIDLVDEFKLRVINIYRSFAPQGGESQQTNLINNECHLRSVI